jgi:hypothetical protein
MPTNRYDTSCQSIVRDVLVDGHEGKSDFCHESIRLDRASLSTSSPSFYRRTKEHTCSLDRYGLHPDFIEGSATLSRWHSGGC